MDKNYELFEAYCIRNVFSLPANHVPSYQRELSLGDDNPSITDADIDAELQAVVSELQKVISDFVLSQLHNNTITNTN
mgnify:FL=1